VIISEWMGYFGIYENMCNSVLIAKKRFLKEGGIMLPGKCRIFMAPYCQEINEALSNEFIAEDPDANFCNTTI
jgi:hypothetical protein